MAKTFQIYNNHTQFAQFIVLIIFTPLGIAITALRFVATRHGARKFGLEDWMAIAATVFFVLVNLAGLVAISILNGRTIEDEIAESPLDYRHMRQWDMAGLYFYFAHILTVKLSVLALFHRIFGVKRAYRIWIYCIGGFQTALSLIFCVFQAFQCQPIDKYFDRSVPGTCKDDGLVVVSGETPNSLVDFAMVALAMVMIRPRQLPAATKWKLRALFGFGIVAGILGFVKIIVTYSMSNIYAFSMVSLWTCVQMFVSLLCCCLPVFQPLMGSLARGSKFWTKLTSRLAGSFSLSSRLGRSSRGHRTSQGASSAASSAAEVYGKRGSTGTDREDYPKTSTTQTQTRGRWSWDSLEQPTTSSAQNLHWPRPPPTYQEEGNAYYSMNDLPVTQNMGSVMAHSAYSPTGTGMAGDGIHVQREFTLVETEVPPGRAY